MSYLDAVDRLIGSAESGGLLMKCKACNGAGKKTGVFFIPTTGDVASSPFRAVQNSEAGITTVECDLCNGSGYIGPRKVTI